MMDVIINGLGIGHGIYYIIGTVAFAFIIYAVFRYTGDDKNPKKPK